MSFQEDFIHGYKKYENNFNDWCQKASTVLGKVTQCGIVETDKDGYALIAINRPDFGEEYIDKEHYTIDRHMTYSKNPIEGFTTQCSNEGIQFIQNNEESLYGKKFDLWYGFTYLEKIDNNINRQYYFGSNTPEIYDNLVNQIHLVKKLIKHFKQENKNIINYYRARKFKISEYKKDYFTNDNYQYQAEREKLVSILHTMHILDEDKTITKKEWQCLKLYTLLKSARQTGDILGISRRTVECHFMNLKKKLKISKKSELLHEIIEQ